MQAGKRRYVEVAAVRGVSGRSMATRVLVGLLVFQAVGALGGGGTFLLDPSGTAAGLDVALLERTPFADFFWPGLLLSVGLGLPAIALAASLLRHTGGVSGAAGRTAARHWTWLGCVALGIGLMTWIVVQVLLIEASLLQPLMFLVGSALAALPCTAGVRRDLGLPGRRPARRQPTPTGG